MRQPPSPSHALLLFLASIALGACAEQDKDDGTGEGGSEGGGSDGGDGDGEIEYPEGCILVDGAGGYAWINDAIAVASPGSTIELCAAQAHEEAVVVNKPVTIISPGSGEFSLTPPANYDAITVTVPGVSLSGFTIQTTNAGVFVRFDGSVADDGSGVLIEDVVVVGAGTWGLGVEDAQNVQVSNSVFSSNTLAGVRVADGSVSLTDTVVDDNTAYGILVEEGATFSGTNISASRTVAGNPESPEDGHGIYVETGASASLTNAQVVDSAFVGVFGDGGHLEVTGSTIENGLYGLVAINGSLTATDTTFTNGAYHGIYAVTPEPVDLAGVRVSGDPALTVNIDDATWSVPDDSGGANYLGVGAFVVSNDIQVDGLDIEGYNDAGMLLAPYDTGTATISDARFVNNGRRGLYISGIPTELTGVSISGTIEVEDQGDDRCLFVDRYAAAVVIGTSASWSGGSVLDNQGYGISNVQGVIVADNLEVGGNSCAGIMNFMGSAIATSNTFSRSGESTLSASVVDYSSNGTELVGNLFTNSQTETEIVYEYDYGTYTTRDVYQTHYGNDIYGYNSAGLTITDGVFENGVNSILLLDTPATILDTTFTNYYGNVVYTSGTRRVSLENSTISEFGDNALYCSQGTIEVENSEFAYGSLYQYDYQHYQDDVLSYEFTSTSLGRVLYSYDCTASFDGVDIHDMQGQPVYNYTSANTALSFVDTSISATGLNPSYTYYPAMQINAYSGTTDIVLEGVYFEDIGDDSAIEVYNDYTVGGYTGTATVRIEDTDVDTTGLDGVRLRGDDIDAEVSGLTITNTTRNGLVLEYGTFGLSNIDITNNGGSGVTVMGGQVTVTDALSGTNALYGLTCSGSPTIDTCDEFTFTDNVTGETSGCELVCGEEVPG